ASASHVRRGPSLRAIFAGIREPHPEHISVFLRLRDGVQTRAIPAGNPALRKPLSTGRHQCRPLPSDMSSTRELPQRPVPSAHSTGTRRLDACSRLLHSADLRLAQVK
ncbi:Protein NTR-2, partial [Aphelenchoides avenae]